MGNDTCQTCGDYFYDADECEEHMEYENHWPYECSVCYKTWPSSEQCAQHETDAHYYCGDCDRSFRNYNAIKQHLNSHIHRGATINCPFCSAQYTTATGVVHHLEAGSCPKARGLSRDQMYRFVRSKDPNGVIAKNLIGWHGSDQFEASERSWNGYGYECYLCHRSFKKLVGLNQHLNSPALDQQALYHCPNHACRSDFKSLAAIINHLESESCGFTRFENVQRGIGNIVRGDRLISF